MSASDPADQPTPAIICLLGTARSGSTLLQRVVELDSRAVGLGEVSRAGELLERHSQCVCGEKLAACTFWTSALQDLRRMSPLITWSKASWLERSRPLRGLLATMTGIRSFASRTEQESARALEGALASLAKDAGSSLFVEFEQGPFRILATDAVGFAPDRPCPSHQGSQSRGLVRSSADRNRSARYGETLGEAQSRHRTVEVAHTALPLANHPLRGFLRGPRACHPQIANSCGKQVRPWAH